MQKQREENKENPAVAQLQQILAENKQLKEDFAQAQEMYRFYISRFQELQKTATLPPAVYNFNIN